MIIIPAIDLRDGKCVRLAQGDASRSTVYSGRPVEVAARWQDRGAEMVHVVDLDGSFTGSPQNQAVIAEMVKTLTIPIQVGGGIRDFTAITSYLSLGVARVILGTMALLNEEFVREAIMTFPGRIVLAVDARDERIAVKGWTEYTEETPASLVKRYDSPGLAAVIFTDISRDGMETGINVEATRILAEAVSTPVIASGGVAGIGDILRLKEAGITGIEGIIIGRALYTGAIDLTAAIFAAKS